MGTLTRHGDEVRDGAGRMVAVWMRGSWYEYAPARQEFVTADPAACKRYERAAPPPAAIDVRWKIALLDRLGVIRDVRRTRT